MPHRWTTQHAAAGAATPATLLPPSSSAYVYSGPGAGTRSVLSTLHSLREALVPAVQVASLDAAQLLAGGWQAGCVLLVLPGGADLPYCRVLNGRGNALIREYVEGGGAYLGLCAGAYFGCSSVEFEPDCIRLRVVGPRELAFFSGASRGSVYSGFSYESEAGAVAAPLRFRCLADADARAEAPGRGSDAAGGADWQQCSDYVNGGPCFVAAGAGAAQQQQQKQPLGDGVEVLATYAEHAGAAAALLCWVGDRGGRAVLCGTHPELHPSWLSGGAPSSAADPSERCSSSGGGGDGAGGTGKPAPCVDSLGGRAAAASALAAELAPAGHAKRLQLALAAGQAQRWRFWRSLLRAAGLGPWLRPL